MQFSSPTDGSMIVSLSRELDLRWKLSSLRSGIIKAKVKDK